MLTPPDIDKIFDIDEIEEINMDIKDNDADNMFDSILDATDEKWRIKLINEGGNCLYERNNEMNDIGFLFAFQTKEQKELANLARVLCLDSTHGMNHYGYHLFTIVMRHPITGSGYSIAFLISQFKRSLILKRWLNFLKYENEKLDPDIFMVDDAGEEIKAVGESFPNRNSLERFMEINEERRRPGHRLDGEVYLLVEIVLRDINFSVLLNELKIACKHIFSVLAQLYIDYDDNKENENVNIEVYDKNVEIAKLQKDLAAIIVEWKEREGYDICSLRKAFRQTAQRERARIARIKVIPQVGEQKINQIASNTKFRKQINF
ncbi:hypothetical protein C2G38_2166112 [Gigaspora rosea]|uniref:ZSWIM1/3 RNaseH-like domain-containing protein n=1 Tax=Gigaspora rosea TaxID=44941 RepID=A0A397VZC4_9GLOM|nr:hypothetical protein C2G38_2166112 [Gigaspora rosea]